MPKIVKKPNEVDRAVIYKSIQAEIFVGKTPITSEIAKEFLGWTEQEKKDDETCREISSEYGKAIALRNNNRNRFITMADLLTYKQEILNKRWRLNGETIVIGKTGLVMSGQHRLLALILAKQDWDASEESFWREIWPTEPVIETIVVKGVEEDDDMFKTMNAGKPATMAEIWYRHEFLKNVKQKDRKPVAKMIEHAVKFLWLRTGAGLNIWKQRQTRSESEDFVKRHKTLLKAVKHIYEEQALNSEVSGKVWRLDSYVTPGYASALMYMMGTSMTDPAKLEKYEEMKKDPSNPPSESCLEFNKVVCKGVANDGSKTEIKKYIWDLVCEFWTELVGGSPDFKGTQAAILACGNADTGETASRSEKIGILIKAWNGYLRACIESESAGTDPVKQHKKFTELKRKYMAEDKVQLKTHEDPETGETTISEVPSVGGIDLGDPKDSDEPSPGADEIEVRKEQIKQERLAKKKEVKEGKGKKIIEDEEEQPTIEDEYAEYADGEGDEDEDE